MAPNPRRRAAQLDALYERLPRLDCQGLCSDSCGPIEVSVVERQRIEAAAGHPLTCGLGASCSMLTADRRCSVYEIRPLLCRLWGIVESMPCHYGCRPEGGLIPDSDGQQLIVEALQIGGDPGGRERLYRQALQELVASMTPEEMREHGRWAASMTSRPPTLEGRDRALPPTVIHDPRRTR